MQGPGPVMSLAVRLTRPGGTGVESAAAGAERAAAVSLPLSRAASCKGDGEGCVSDNNRAISNDWEGVPLD